MMQLDNSGPIVDQGDHDLYRPSGLLEIGKAASQCQVGVLVRLLSYVSPDC